MSESDGSKGGLLAKLHVAQKAAEGVAKHGTNTQQKYHYAKAEDVIKAAQGYLQDAGLVAFMEFSAPEPREVESNSGTAGVLVSVSSTLIIADPESPRPEWQPDLQGDIGPALKVRGFGSGIDYPGDKAIYKAMTGAAKYAYASALGIPFTDDPEGTDAPERKPRGGGGEASAAQKRAITSILNEAGVPRELQKSIVHAVGGDPLTKQGASKILDIIADKDRPLEERKAALIEASGVTPPSDVPADTSDLPPEDDGGTTLEAHAEGVDQHKAPSA